jgi:hypothetical protein
MVHENHSVRVKKEDVTPAIGIVSGEEEERHLKERRPIKHIYTNYEKYLQRSMA